MIRKVKIGKYLAEGILIVVSILLAFSIEAWWEFRKVSTEEKKLLQNLHADFTQNRQLLDVAITHHEGTMTNCQELMDMIHPRQSNKGVMVPDSLLFRALLWHTYDPVVGTLNSAISSGRISLIQSDELRTELAIWEDLVRDMKESEEVDYEIMTKVNEEVFHYMPVRSYAYRQGATPMLRESTASPDYERFLGSLYVENLLANRVGEMSIMIREAEWVSESLDRILSLLDNELK